MARNTDQKMLAVLTLSAYVVQWLFLPMALANPTGPDVVLGHGTVSGLGTSQVTITQASQQAIINWQTFNNAPNEVIQFNQPNVHSVALNRIFDQNPSQILGSLRANGTVILLNPNGVMFGPTAQVNVGGLIVSSLKLSNDNFMRGFYSFEGTGIEGAVKNMGQIQTAHGGGVYLLAPNVENSGVITSPGGNIVLAAGAKVYLSNRPDGHGLMAEVSAPTGQAVNAKDLIADGGHITIAGRVVNQAGLVQANSVRQKNGKIEMYASEQLTLKAGSQTLAKGDGNGRSKGGTILAVAEKLSGSAIFEKGAVIDVSGGAKGGNAGFAELSGSRVSLGGLFVGKANREFRGGRLLIDPTTDLDLTGFAATDFSDISFSTPRDAAGNLVAGHDLRVTGFFDLNSVQPPATGGTIRFDAGQDLIFRDLTLWTNPFGTPTKWDIVGAAERNILFTGFTGTTLQTAYGGSINLQANTGNVNLIDPQTGVLATVRAQGGGGISIKTGQDLIASTGFDESGGPLGLFSIRGINIDGPGRLNLEVGRDFIGGPANGVPSGPGFVLWNSDPTVSPQHTVTVGGKIGETNLTLGPNGLPLTAAEQRARNQAVGNPNAPLEIENSSKYADFALSGGQLSVTARGNIYLGRVRDAGLLGGLDAQGNPRDPQFAPGLENTKVSFVSQNGNIILNTNPVDAGRQGTPVEVLSSLLPASFEAKALQGTVQIRSNLKFLPSPTGSVKFYAKQDIQGVPKTGRGDNPNFIWLYVGFGGLLGGQWVAVDQRTIPQRPDLWPFINNIPGSKTLPPRPGSQTDPPIQFPEYARMDVDRTPPTVKLLEVNPNDLVGNPSLDQVAALVNNNRPIAPANSSSLAEVSFKAEQGSISKLFLDLVSRPFQKQVTIEAGSRIEQFNVNIYLPDLGTQTQTVTERVPLILDPITNQPRAIRPNDVILIRAVNPQTQQTVIRPWNGTEPVDPANLVNVVFRDVPVTVTSPIPSATIKAQDIVLNKSDAGVGGLQFSGQGTARVIATRNLDLADGRGILLDRSKASDQGGLLDIAVGNNLDMVTSAIISRNGAGISIHGYDPLKPYVLGYDNSALYPSYFPDSVRGGINLPAIGGHVNVGANNPRSAGGPGSPTGIQNIQGGSTGQMAKEAVVNPDGTVTVSVVKDPAAILVRATSDINVNKSRIASFGGGDIRLTSTQGNINAGSGSKNERAEFAVDVPQLDSQGHPIIDPTTGEPKLTRTVYVVPGSGIFTFSPNDPQPIVIPKFNDPEINALLAEAARQRTFGRDVSQLEARANRLKAEREPLFNENVIAPYIRSLKLGDITLAAEQGKIIIPPAGIRGRVITLIAKEVEFQGGSISGLLDKLHPIPPTTGTPSFSIPQPGVPSNTPPLSGGGTVAAASSTAAATGNSVKNSDKVQEETSESSSQQAQPKGKQFASKEDNDDAKRQMAKSMRIKRGVVIQVDVKAQQ